VGALGAGCEATTGVYPPAGTAFRLDRVGPIPASGPVRIEFELAREAAIELEIFDIQGRLVASPARGAWPAGGTSSSGRAWSPTRERRAASTWCATAIRAARTGGASSARR
jgi:hypothetical protein